MDSLSLAGTFSTYPNPAINVFQAFGVEFVITAVLMCLILALTDDGNGVPKGSLAPLLIGILVAVIGASMGPLTGFAMNPARDFGPKCLPTSLAGAISPLPEVEISPTSSFLSSDQSSVPVLAPWVIAYLSAATCRATPARLMNKKLFFVRPELLRPTCKRFPPRQ